MTRAHLRRLIASSVVCWAAAAPSGAATINAPATSTGTFTASWPSGYELRLARRQLAGRGSRATSATFTAVPPGEYRFVLAACSWSITTELGALYLATSISPRRRPSRSRRGGTGRRGVDAEAGAPHTVRAWDPGQCRDRGAAQGSGGINGVALDLALEYDSARNGDRPRYVADDLLGYGWALRGVPYIHRCRAGSTLDSSLNGLPTLTSSDGICLDGEPLVKVGGRTGASARSTARPRIPTSG